MTTSAPTKQSPYGRRVRFMSGPWGFQVPPGSVDRQNRIILGMAVIRRGEALGHDTWIDEVFLDEIHLAGNLAPRGIKCRFTHPGLCADGLGKYLGKYRNFRRDGDCVRADLHISETTQKAPEFPKDPAEYIMDLAEKDPDAGAASVVFFRNRTEETQFLENHSSGQFTSPDPLNTKNLVHLRLAKLDACDIVDDPAANPDGFFSRGEETAARAEQTLAWLTRIQGARTPGPEILGRAQPQRIREFFDGFLARHNLEIVAAKPTGKETPMAHPNVCRLQEGETPKYCVCPEGDHYEDYVPGNPCAEKTCPTHGTPLVGSQTKPGEEPAAEPTAQSAAAAACRLQEGGETPKYCVCSEGDYFENYVPGSPCAEKTCPTHGTPLVGSQTKPGETPATPAEPESQSRAHWKALRSAFPKDVEFATECFDKGITLSNARAKFIAVLRDRIDEKDAEIRKLSAENTAIKAQLLTGEGAPVPPTGELKTAPGAAFSTLVRAYQKKNGVDFEEAVKMCRLTNKKEFDAAREAGLI